MRAIKALAVMLFIIVSPFAGLFLLIETTFSTTSFPGWTVTCPVAGGQKYIGYGLIVFAPGKQWFSVSYGVDLSAPVGSPVVAADSGRVVAILDSQGNNQYAPPEVSGFNVQQWKDGLKNELDEWWKSLAVSGYHQFVVVNVDYTTPEKTDRNGQIIPPVVKGRRYVYGFLSDVGKFVSIGKHVKRGDRIASVSNTGGGSQPFVTFSIFERNSQNIDGRGTVNPEPVLPWEDVGGVQSCRGGSNQAAPPSLNLLSS